MACGLVTFPNAIQKDRGEPSKVRIGTMTSGGFVLQGTILEDVGLLDPNPVDGDSVAIVGQSAVGTSGASWLVLGATHPGEQSRWTDYTPILTADIANPTLGDSVLTGRWIPVGYKTINVELFFQVGAGWAPGLGRYFFSTPFPPTAQSRTMSTGACYIFDAGVANRTAIVNIFNASDNFFMTASPAGDVGNGVPQVWAANDEIRFSIIMEIV